MPRLPRASTVWLFLPLLGCATEPGGPPLVEVTNPTGAARGPETVELSRAEVERLLPESLASGAAVVDSVTGEVVVSQTTDGEPDALLFLVEELGPNSVKRYRLATPAIATAPDPERRTFGRFVPERADDFAWENDLVAFRMYGPALATDAVNSGVDCWLKRVGYPIVDKWYAEDQKGKSYHEDHGEGYDPYHVGASRGCGGLAVWEDGQMHPSNVFATWKVLENGPVRTAFELTYEPWEVGGKRIEETTLVSIDLGSRLARFESTFRVDGRTAPLTVAIGITTHDGAAETGSNADEGWIRCWETIDGSGLGTGVVLAPGFAGEVVEFTGAGSDDDHVAWIVTTGSDGRIAWYAGYGWERAGEIETAEEWERYLSGFSAALRAPLGVVVTE